MSTEHPSYITVYESIGGWKALKLWWNPEYGGFYEPWDTGLGAYHSEAEAEVEARRWAEEEELEFRPRKKTPPLKCTCGHFACVCAIRAAHKETCSFRRAATGPVGIACDHGFDVCPKCDPCTCGKGVRIEEIDPTGGKRRKLETDGTA